MTTGQDEGADIRAQSTSNSVQNSQSRFVDVLFSCSIHQRIKGISWPWNVVRQFDNKLSSHASLFESGYSFKLKKTVTELFQYDSELSLESKTMLLIGSSGIGKTTLCEEIKYQWSNRKILNDTKYFFLINVNDSTMKNICSLNDLACYSDLSNQLQGEKEFFDNDNSITIIIDDYEKLPDHHDNTFINGLIGRQILKQCQLIITVHPVALGRLQKLVDVSLNVQLLGFDTNGINVCIQQNLQGHPDKISTLLSYLDENSSVKGLCYIPTLLMILIRFVKEHKSLSSHFNAIELAISHFLFKNNNKNLSQENLSINYFSHLSELSFDSIRNRQLNDLCNFGCSCVKEFLIADYITKLKSPYEQFELLKKYLFEVDLIGSWAQLNMQNITNFGSHSIFRSLKIKSNIPNLSNLIRFGSVYTMFHHFQYNGFKICNKVVFQALCFMHSEEVYYRNCPSFQHEGWYYNNMAYDFSL